MGNRTPFGGKGRWTNSRNGASAVHNRQIDTLIGLCKGILADGEVKQSEVEFLHGWIIANAAEVADNPVFHGLFATVEKVLADGVLNPDETLEIRGLLEGITGSPVALGEILKSAHFPVDDPAPPVRFAGHTFLFTGTFAYGDRKQCERAGIARELAPRILDAAIAGDGFTMAPGEVAGLVSGIEKERLGKGCMRPVIEDSPC